MQMGSTTFNIQNWCIYLLQVSKKKNGVKNLTRKGSHWGRAPFRVGDDPEIGQLDAKYDPELGQSDPLVCQVCRKLTDFRVVVDPEWSLAPMDPFPGHADPGVLECSLMIIFPNE